MKTRMSPLSNMEPAKILFLESGEKIWYEPSINEVMCGPGGSFQLPPGNYTLSDKRRFSIDSNYKVGPVDGLLPEVFKKSDRRKAIDIKPEPIDVIEKYRKYEIK